MKKQFFYSTICIATLIFIGGGWYLYKFRICVQKIDYVPPREQEETGGGFSGLRHVADKGNYYRFDFREFQTSKDAMRACIWK